MRKLHADEVATDASLARRLVAAQFPQWADLEVEPVEEDGTDNATYRLGDELSVRLPRGPRRGVGQVDKDLRWLPMLAPLLPLAVPVDWQGRPVWVHGDLMPGNLLAREGRLSAVIDFSALCVGDPANDVMVAWTFLTAETRGAFRAELGVDDATWARGRGWALSWALIALPYYLHTHPPIVRDAGRTIDEVLADPESV